MKPRHKEGSTRLNKDNRREKWLKEVKDAIHFEKAYLRVKVKDKEFD